ncbi:MAG: glycosyltransferase [Flavobacterium sp. BFFFF1]|uniref:glycosyltransferase family 2 protein n=1 Tax=unclassified Flavobacterium TaxID=196869 RepID=UPI000BD77602|nr:MULTISPECIES: glycosyltransferase family 2 protein [unclassified Flavobacterium]OYU81334.1 MAG: glycosyltransferase [Flavobacterium sp. BFFFF1]
MREAPHISIVSPVYKAEAILENLVSEIHLAMKLVGKTYEVILVDDRSPDNSWDLMTRISANDPNIKSVRLSRNFGQHPAIMAGLSCASGEWIVVMDCDLQDQPKEITKLYHEATNGYDIVLARRKNRKDGFLKKISSKLFSIAYSYLTETKFDNTIANFGIFNKKVISEVLLMNDYIKSFPLFVNWVGFRSTVVDVEHAGRESGKSSYTFSKLLSLAFNTIISFSDKPLKLFVKFGMIMSLFSFVFGLVTVYRYFDGEIQVLGYSSLMVSIWFLSGIIITTIGIVGIYVGKIFDQSKNRKPFIIDQILN